MRAAFIASRKSVSSAASMVIWVKKTMSSGSWARRDMSSKRSARRVSSSVAGGVLLQSGQVQIGEGHGIEIVIGESNETKSETAQLDNFFDDRIRSPLPGTLAVRAPDRAERAMLGTTTHRLHRRPHVTTARDQFPPRGGKTTGLDLASVVEGLWSAFSAVGQGHRPGHVAIA